MGKKYNTFQEGHLTQKYAVCNSMVVAVYCVTLEGVSQGLRHTGADSVLKQNVLIVCCKKRDTNLPYFVRSAGRYPILSSFKLHSMQTLFSLFSEVHPQKLKQLGVSFHSGDLCQYENYTHCSWYLLFFGHILSCGHLQMNHRMCSFSFLLTT